MMKTRMFLTAVSAASVLSCAFPAFAGVTIGDQVPLMTLEDIDGASMRSISEFKSKVVMITVWASWCGVCRTQMPQMVRLQQELGPKGLTIVAINVDEPRSSGLKYIRDMEKSGRLGFTVLHDGGREAKKKLGYTGVPNNFIVGSDGTVLDIIRGGIDAGGYEETKTEIAAFIEGKGAPGRNAAAAEERDIKRGSAGLKIDPSRVIVSEGILEKNEVAGVLQSAAVKIWGCYKKEQEKRPTLQGDVLVRFIVGTDGRVEKAVIEQSYMDSEALDNCLVDVIGRLVFARPRGGSSVVRYPFQFKRE